MFKPHYILVITLLLTLSQVAWADSQKKRPYSIIRYDAIHSPIVARRGMVVSQRQIASEIGADILRRGGNAIDAAVGVGFALSVVLPRAGNLGGGGFMLIHLAEQDKTITIDYRETAPKAAHRDMYLHEDGSVNRAKYRSGILSAAVPGTVAGLTHALDQYGSMELAEVLQPVIRLAEEGIIMDYDTASAMITRNDMLQEDADSRVTFFHPDGSPYQAGDHFKQPQLAWSLKEIAKHGAKAFYTGEIAQKIVADMKRKGGIMTLGDLAQYRPVERTAIEGSYRGHRIVSMPPPSSGGVHVIQMLNILENFDIASMGSNSAQSLHLIAEAMRRAYADRSKHLGDPDFYRVPIDWLTSKPYAEKIAASIDLDQATPSSVVSPGKAPPYESEDTTHFSVVDEHGNAVSNTYTLNFSFGSGVVVHGAGFLLNNEMTDFNAKPGVADAFGLLGGKANSIEAQKRPLSAMTPTLVFNEDELLLVTGSPGGSRIINTVLQQLINVIDHKMNLADATHSPRIHHQWQPDQLQLERSINADTRSLLKAKGHKTTESGTMGSLQSIMRKENKLHGASDPRRPGAGVAAVN